MPEDRRVYTVEVEGVDEPHFFLREGLATTFAGEVLFDGVDVHQDDFPLCETDEQLAALIEQFRAEREEGTDA